MTGAVHGQQIRNIKSIPKFSTPHQNAIAGDYYEDIDSELDKFVGNWLFQSSNKKVELSVSKITRHYFMNTWQTIYVDKLSVEFRYYENGQLIKETAAGFYTDLDQIEMLNLISNPEIGPNNPLDDGYSIIEGTYREPFNSNCSNPESGTLYLSYKTQNNIVNGVSTTGKLFWEVRTRALNRNMTGVTCADNYVLPANMIFIKQP
jgi:hypothetical protein